MQRILLAIPVASALLAFSQSPDPPLSHRLADIAGIALVEIDDIHPIVPRAHPSKRPCAHRVEVSVLESLHGKLPSEGFLLEGPLAPERGARYLVLSWPRPPYSLRCFHELREARESSSRRDLIPVVQRDGASSWVLKKKGSILEAPEFAAVSATQGNGDDPFLPWAEVRAVFVNAGGGESD